MLDKKDKYRLRALANPLKPLVIIGKDGLTEKCDLNGHDCYIDVER